MTRRSPLHAAHEAAGAKFAAFGGWEMPLNYTDGVLAEHGACREDAVVFDVSHLGSVRVVGEGSAAALQRTFTNDLQRIGPGRAQYTHLLDPADAHVVDDVIVWWVASDEFRVMPNASNTAPLVAARRAEAGAGVRVDDVTADRAVLAVQGPRARAHLDAIAPELACTPRFAVERVTWRGHECVVAGTGYTGEDGVEIDVPASGARALWDALLDGGIVPAGLGARDLLRLEMGYPLHGHELGPGITPLQAGLGWVVGFDKGKFRGRAPLLAEREAGVPRHLRGLVTDGRKIPREGCPVLKEGAPIGEITSGNFSPSLGRGIALAFVPPDLPLGAEVEIDVRGRPLPATLVAPPFLPPRP